jgi:hypothetical protein
MTKPVKSTAKTPKAALAEKTAKLAALVEENSRSEFDGIFFRNLLNRKGN